MYVFYMYMSEIKCVIVIVIVIYMGGGGNLHQLVSLLICTCCSYMGDKVSAHLSLEYTLESQMYRPIITHLR